MVNGGPQSSNLLKKLFTVHQTNTWENEVESSNLCSRAWVYQEVHLASRVLYSASQQLSWNCASFCAKGACPNEELKANAYALRRLSSPTLKLVNKDSFYIFDLFGHHWISGIVHAYSEYRLTYASDKLIAVSGLVKEMVQLMREGSLAPDEHVPGL